MMKAMNQLDRIADDLVEASRRKAAKSGRKSIFDDPERLMHVLRHGNDSDYHANNDDTRQ